MRFPLKLGAAALAGVATLACPDVDTRFRRCAEGCTPQPCAAEYPIPWEPETLVWPANVDRALERCEEPTVRSDTQTLQCSSDRIARVEFDELGRVLLLEMMRGVVEQSWELAYDGALLRTFHQRNFDLQDGTVESDLAGEIEWDASNPVGETARNRHPGEAQGDPRAADGEYFTYLHGRSWSRETHLPIREETRVGAAAELLQSRDFEWTGEALTRVTHAFNTGDPDEPADLWESCDAVAPGVFECLATFEYSNGAMESFTFRGTTTTISDRCCEHSCVP